MSLQLADIIAFHVLMLMLKIMPASTLDNNAICNHLHPNHHTDSLLLLRARSTRHSSAAPFILSRIWYPLAQEKAQHVDGKLFHTLTAHESPVPRSLASFPESTTRLADEYGSTDSAVLGSIDLFSGAEATVSISTLIFQKVFHSGMAYQIIRLACSLG
jgi:hypothetical protein